MLLVFFALGRIWKSLRALEKFTPRKTFPLLKFSALNFSLVFLKHENRKSPEYYKKIKMSESERNIKQFE
jgi:hypothetical protein